MNRSIDARIPVVFGESASVTPDDAVLVVSGMVPAPEDPLRCEIAVPQAAHPAGCTCCVPRGPVATALSLMFQQRARGEVPFFTRVLCVAADGTAPGAAAHRSVETALAADPVASVRFRLG